MSLKGKNRNLRWKDKKRTNSSVFLWKHRANIIRVSSKIWNKDRLSYHSSYNNSTHSIKAAL